MAAVVTDMDQPLGYAVGNALEVKEAIAVLRGEDVADLRELCLVLGTQILTRCGAAPNETEARRRLEQSLTDGSALKKLAEMVEAQGGNSAAVYDTALLTMAPVVHTVKAPVTGYIHRIHARGVGQVSMILGGGRATKEDTIDQSVGVVLRAKAGDFLSAGEPLAEIHAACEADALRGEKLLLDCYQFTDEAPILPPFIRGVEI